MDKVWIILALIIVWAVVLLVVGSVTGKCIKYCKNKPTEYRHVDNTDYWDPNEPGAWDPDKEE